MSKKTNKKKFDLKKQGEGAANKKKPNLSKSDNGVKKVKTSQSASSGKTINTKKEVKKRLQPTTSKTQRGTAPQKATKSAIAGGELIFGRKNYILMAAGAALVALGMILMLGGWMEDPNVWDENVIFSFRRTFIAPMVILAGLIVEVFAIFK